MTAISRRICLTNAEALVKHRGLAAHNVWRNATIEETGNLKVLEVCNFVKAEICANLNKQHIYNQHPNKNNHAR